MNIRVRAAGEVILSVVGIIVLSTLTAAGLEAILNKFGIQAVLFGIGAGIAGYLMYMAYQIRLGQLEFRENLRKIDSK